MAARQHITSSSLQLSVAPVAEQSARRVLIVDDEPEVRSLLEDIVKQAIAELRDLRGFQC